MIILYFFPSSFTSSSSLELRSSKIANCLHYLVTLNKFTMIDSSAMDSEPKQQSLVAVPAVKNGDRRFPPGRSYCSPSSPALSVVVGRKQPLSEIVLVIFMVLSFSTIPSLAFQFHSMSLHSSGGLPITERQQAAATSSVTTTMLSMVARRYNDGDDGGGGDDEDEERTLASGTAGIPQLPPMSYWRATGSSSSTGDASSVDDSSSPCASIAASSATTRPAFISSKFELQYTCKKCETRNRVLVSRQAYREGMVIAICNGCNAKHMIADNLHKSSGYHIEDRPDLLRVSTDVFNLEKVLDLTGLVRDENGNTVLE